MVKVLLASAVVLCRQDPEHHLSEEHKAGNQEVAAVPWGAVPGVLEFAEASLADSGGMPGQTSNPVPGPEVVPIICLWNEHFYRWKAPT